LGKSNKKEIDIRGDFDIKYFAYKILLNETFPGETFPDEI